METKNWWESKTIWSGVIAILVAVYNAWLANQATFGINLPPIPEWIFGILGAMGVWGRATATKTIATTTGG